MPPLSKDTPGPEAGRPARGDPLPGKGVFIRRIWLLSAGGGMVGLDPPELECVPVAPPLPPEFTRVRADFASEAASAANAAPLAPLPARLDCLTGAVAAPEGVASSPAGSAAPAAPSVCCEGEVQNEDFSASGQELQHVGRARVRRRGVPPCDSANLCPENVSKASKARNPRKGGGWAANCATKTLAMVKAASRLHLARTIRAQDA